MEFRKNDEIRLTITDLGNDGEGIGKIDGFPFFIKDTAVGDTVSARVIKVRKTYGYARLLSVLEPSPFRTLPLCPVSKACGGCRLQHMTYEAELDWKEKRVHDCLLRIGGLPEKILKQAEEGILGMEKPWRYRNKAQYPVGRDASGRIVAGFYAGRTHDIIPCGDCVLSPPEFSVILRTVLDYMNGYRVEPYDEKSGEGLIRHILVRKGFGTGELMVCLVTASPRLPHREELLTSLSGIPGIASVCLNVNPDRTNVILGRETLPLWGKDHIADELGGLRFRISPASFYQVNPVQALRIYETAVSWAEFEGGEEVWDICCGIGTISLFAARALMAKGRADGRTGFVHGLELVPEAVLDARRNAEWNGLSNVEFITAAAESGLPEYLRLHPEAAADVVFVDPPRKGLDPSVISAVAELRPEKILYISCDPATLARDLKLLMAAGYRLRKYRAFDQFCRTPHTETVVKLERSGRLRDGRSSWGT